MKIAVIGSTQYQIRMNELADAIRDKGHEVRLPAFDNFDYNELEIILHNRSIVEWADVVYILWDGRSMGTVFDFGMAVALRKKIKIFYLNKKSIVNAMLMYEDYINKKDEEEDKL